MSTTTATRPAAPGPGTTANSRWPSGHPRRRLILLVLCLSLLVVVIDNTILNTALPTLARVLHAGTSSLQWITDAYTLCFAALLIPAGALGDRYGRRLSLLGGLTVFALGSAAAAFASGAGMLIGARVVMGLGAAFVMPATLSILNAVFPPKERPQAIAAWSAVTGIGIVIGPTLGGLLLSHLWWGSVFLINIPLVALALAGVILTVPETAEPGGHRLDIPGTVLIGGALFAIVDAIIEAPGRGWTATVTLAELAAGLAALAVFAWWELRIAHPLVDLRIFASRAFSTAAAVGDRHLLRPVRQPVRADPVPAAGARLQPAVRRAARAAVRPGHRRHVAAVADPGQALRHPPGHPGRHGADGHSACSTCPPRACTPPIRRSPSPSRSWAPAWDW